jgi:hypothetical protein
LPIRHVPRPRRYAPDRPLDHRTWQLPRLDLAVRLVPIVKPKGKALRALGYDVMNLGWT